MLPVLETSCLLATVSPTSDMLCRETIPHTSLSLSSYITTYRNIELTYTHTQTNIITVRYQYLGTWHIKEFTWKSLICWISLGEAYYQRPSQMRNSPSLVEVLYWKFCSLLVSDYTIYWIRLSEEVKKYPQS